MRPRLLHLGYGRRAGRALVRRQGFNEAEAFTPRISGARQSMRLWCYSFNEAEAFTPRICLARILTLLPAEALQ